MKERTRKSLIIGFIFAVAWTLLTMAFAEVFMSKMCNCWDDYNRRYILKKYSFEGLDCGFECEDLDLRPLPLENPKDIYKSMFNFSINIDVE